MRYVLRVEADDLKPYERELLAAAPGLGVKMDQPTYLVLRDAKGAVGTAVHKIFEEGFRGVFTADYPSVAEGHVRAVHLFFFEHRPKPLELEQVVYSKRHRFAGRFDARVKVGGGVFLLDLKTGYVGRSAHVQMVGYDLAAEECGVGASDKLFILQTRENGTYTLWPCRSTRADFLLALGLYRAGLATDKATRADYKQLVAA